MRRKAIPAVIILFSLMLLGIIGIQVWWISKSLQLNEEAFDSAVYRSLSGVVAQLEKQENFTLVKKEFGRDSIISLISKHRTEEGKAQHKRKVYSETFTYSDADDTNLSKSVEIHTKDNSVSVGTSESDLLPEENGLASRLPKPNRAVVKGANSSNTTYAESYAYVSDKKGNEPASVRVEVGSNGKKVTIVSHGHDQEILNEGSDEQFAKVNTRLKDLDTMIEKMIRIKAFDSASVNYVEIDSILQNQLRQNGINAAKFNLELIKDGKVHLYKSPGFNDTKNIYQISLYPNDLFGRDIKLVATFPLKFMQSNPGIWWAFGLSILFTMAMLSLFIYSIRMLIKHKNLLNIKNDFISHMSHEFKTPLAGISIGADMISEKADRMTLEQITKTAQSIKEQSNRLNKDISSVLLSALVEEKITKEKAPFNIVDTIKQVLQDFKLTIESRNAQVTTGFASEIVIVDGNEMLWRKVISNLLDNSIKFSLDAPFIFINVKPTGDRVIIEFSDKGNGIDKHDLPHIFEKFYRSNYRSKSNVQGFGLGLNFVKKVVDMQNGSIKITSEPGNGTFVLIEIPAGND